MKKEEVIEKIKELGGEINYFDIHKIFLEPEEELRETLRNFSLLLQEGILDVREEAKDRLILFLKPKEIKESIKPLEFSSEEIVVPPEYIDNRMYIAIVDYVLEQIERKYYIKTLRNNGQTIGTFLWDGRRYVEADEIVQKIFYDSLEKHREFLELNNLKMTALLKEFLFKMKNRNVFEFDKKELISFKNCVLDWDNFCAGFDEAFLPHSHLLICFNYIDYDIDILFARDVLKLFRFREIDKFNLEEIAKKACPKALKVFKEWVGEKWILLFELIGYCFFPRYVFHKAIMLVGDGSNGKSTYLKLLRTILGKENITSISIQDLCSSRFALAELYGKLANIYPDLEKRALKDTGIFKIATGEDFVSADRKFKGRINFENYAKLFFSANELPLVSDMTYAFWRRWIVIQFPNKFQQIDNFFEKTFTKEEIEGVILVSLFAFRNVLLRKKFSFEESEVDYKEVWLRSSDSVYAFIQDSIENKILKREEGAKEKTTDVYQLYLEYCEREDREAVEKATFTKRMEMYGFPKTHTKATRYYKNIKILNKEEEPEEEIKTKEEALKEFLIDFDEK